MSSQQDKNGWKSQDFFTSPHWMGGSRLHDEIILDGRVYTFMTSQDWKKESVLHDKTGLDGRVRPS